MTDTRTETTRMALLAACQERGHCVSGDGRVPETVAAELLGVAFGTMRNWRTALAGPPYFRIRGRIYYRIVDLALFVEGGREDHCTNPHERALNRIAKA